MSFTCPDCLRTSHHPMDELHKYCGNCCEYKPFSIELTDFQSVIARTIQGQEPKTYALRAAHDFQWQTDAPYGSLMLQSLSLLNATRLSGDQLDALNAVIRWATASASQAGKST